MGFIIFIVVIILLYNFFKTDKTSKRDTYNNQQYRGNSTSSSYSRQYSNQNTSTQPKSSVLEVNSQNELPNTSAVNQVKTPIKFLPDSTNFKAGYNTGQYNYYYLYDYYPVSRFSYGSLTLEQINERNSIFNFKDGNNPEFYARKLASALINRFGAELLKNKILLIIPASTSQKTRVRFEKFLDKLSEFTGSINGFNYLKNSQIERNPQHTGGNSISASNLEFTADFKFKDVIVIDDVRTQGRSSNLVYSELKKRGVNSVVFCYFGRTVPL